MKEQEQLRKDNSRIFSIFKASEILGSDSSPFLCITLLLFRAYESLENHFF